MRVRSKVTGTAKSPRLTVFKSNTHIYGQLVDDIKQVTLVSANDLKVKTGKKTEKAEKVGEELAKKYLAKKISPKAIASGGKKVAFDRNGFRYHGRIKALADGARKGGLEF